jgi:hypothetical protein
MAKYRILEENGKFYPQEKRFWLIAWEYIDRDEVYLTWSIKNNSICKSLNEAEEVIEKRIAKINKKKSIIHEYNPQNNG